ncbi:S-layer homology domain-containing protein [Butyricicoccus sp. AF15-40]|nr:MULTISPECIES: S-layer homology domain-containing protein [unclassified Butyricicoccus]RHR86354.1 S-layer homology domain-containing protein [Butyricicoccus sp. AF15-40]
MFAGAAFTDQADIKVKSDVVDTLVSLGVIEGFEDGSFQPNGTVTRAQMAKMIYVLRTGNSDASAYNDDKTTFTDINGHWARGYIKYCQSLNIIAGKSSTIFAPNASVTAQEAAKMLLVTLGYDAQKAGLVGSGWASKTNALADENGLLDDVNTSFTAACPRQYAAQLIYNAIDAKTVVWRDDAYTNQTAAGTDNKTIGEKYMGLNTAEGVMSSFQKEDGKSTYTMDLEKITKKNGTESAKNKYFDDLTFTKIAKDFTSLKNQKVKVLYKGTDEVYGVFALAEDNTSIAAVLGQFDKDTDTRIKYNGNKYNVKDKATVKVDGKDVVANKVNVSVATFVDNGKTYNKGMAKAFNAKAISNDGSSKVNTLTVETFAVAKVSYVGKDYINLTDVFYSKNDALTTTSGVKYATAKLKSDDAIYPSDLAKDDYVIVTPEANSVENDKVTVSKLDTVTGKVSSTKNKSTDDDYQVKIDGTWYEMAIDEGNDVSKKYSKIDAGDTIKVVVKDGYIVSVDDLNATPDDVALCIEVGATSGIGAKYEADLLFADGSRQTVTVKDDVIKNSKVLYAKYDTNVTGNGVLTGTAPTENTDKTAMSALDLNNDTKPFLVSYDKSGSKYELTAIGGSKLSGYDQYTQTTIGQYADKVDNNRLQTNTTKYIDDNATVIVRYDDGDKYSVITGKTLKGWKNTNHFDSAVLANQDGGAYYAQLIYVNLNKSSVPGSESVYAYLFDGPEYYGKSGDVDAYYEYSGWDGSKDVTVKIYKDDISTVLPEGTVISYTVDADGFASFDADDDVWTPSEMTKGAIIGGQLDSDLTGSVQFNGQNVMDIDEDDDPIVLFVDVDGGEGAIKTSFTTAQKDGENYKNNAVYATTGTNIKVLVVDAGDNDLAASKVFNDAK